MDIIKKIISSILTLEARIVLWRYQPKIIAVTGSVGKTTTKDAIFAAISRTHHVRKTQKSLNSEFGVPLTILGLESGWNDPFKWFSNIVQGFMLIIVRTEYPEWLVLEVGADRPGDIRRIARWVRPDIAVITMVPNIPVHVEYFDSPEQVLKEKRALAEYLKPGGSLILFGDDEKVRETSTTFKGAVTTYGFLKTNSLYASHDEVLYEESKPVGVTFRVDSAGNSVPVQLRGALGRPRIYAALAAMAVANILGSTTIEAAQGLSEWEPTPGRLRLLAGLHGSTIIDDTYNASPAATMAALETLAGVSAQRRIAMLGDMLELGKFTAESHKEIGASVASRVNMLITVGFRARLIGESALDNGLDDNSIREYENNESERAGLELAPEVQAGDVILVKGSQSIRMERAVACLMAEPGRADELLVRQDEEWKRR